jgi:hypothetical protein
LLWGEVYMAGRRGPWRGKIPEADGGRRAAPDPELHRRRCKVGAGFEFEGGHLVLLVADVQRKVMQGAANDGVGAIVQRLERCYVAVPPHEHRRCAGEVIGQLRGRWRAVAVMCLVAVCSAALSVLENCSRKSFEGNSGESKN